eukprot:COSAG02_NODE_10590_length_1904_cov_35.837244_4_plen_60_part_00
MIRLIWKTETAPDAFLEGVFCPIWKHKGTKNAMNTYRFVCLANTLRHLGGRNLDRWMPT